MRCKIFGERGPGMKAMIVVIMTKVMMADDDHKVVDG